MILATHLIIALITNILITIWLLIRKEKSGWNRSTFDEFSVDFKKGDLLAIFVTGFCSLFWMFFAPIVVVVMIFWGIYKLLSIVVNSQNKKTQTQQKKENEL